MNLFGFKKSSDAPEIVETTAASAPATASDDAPQLGALDAQTAAPVADSPVSSADMTADVAAPVALDLDAIAPIDSPPIDSPPTEGPVQPLISSSEPLRALFPGSFLAGEYEIKEVVSRGQINYYLADAGDYGAADLKLVGERLAPANRVETEVEADFFPPATRWAQDDREYAAWDWQNLKPLDEWQAQPNDETYLHVIGAVARGLLALENAGLKPDFARESLFFDASGELKSFGFFDAAGAGLPPSSNPALAATSEETAASERLEEGGSPAFLSTSGMTAIHQLSALSSRFAKTNLAAGATLRLDDEFGALPFSQEVKSFARALSDGAFSSASEVVTALERFAPVRKTEVRLLTDVGMERELNEDCGLTYRTSRAGHARNVELEVLAVADGMGGHEGGEVASDVTLSALETAISRRQTLDFADNAAVLGALNEILGEVNDAVVRLTENPPYASMRAKPGSTLVCALRLGSRLFLGNVGDSRAYRWNADSGLQRWTKDHSYVQDLLDSGSISEEQAWGHPDGSVITSHIGMMRGLKRDVSLRLIRPGDRVILVSDGVVDTLRDAEIEAIVAANGEASSLCAALVNAANEAGGFDNITVAALICG